MDDHPQRHLPHPSSRLDHPPHHPHFQAHYRHQQDIHGPLSAGVVEGRRAFPFHSSLRSTPLSFSTPAPPSTNLSVADILDKYQDANSDFLVSILNAKAKEDERKAEEERYKTEQIKLQSKQLELELAKEKRRGGSPSAARPGYASESSTGHYSSSSNSYYNSSSNNNNNSSSNNNHPYSPYPSGDGPRSHQPNGSSIHRDHHNVHGVQDTQDYAPSPVRQDMHMLPSPQSRPPVLKINTSVRQYVPQPHSSQRLPPSPRATLPPLPSTTPSKSNGRHYNLPPLSTSSAQSSPIGVVDYQSHIPPPVTPKDDLSPTSALSPTQSHNMKRKSIHHDAVMDAVRAKVFRNASASAASGQYQQKKSASNDSERESSRRKIHHGPTSPEATKRPTELPQPVSAPAPSEPKQQQQQQQDEYRPVKLEGALLSSLPLTTSPHSPSPGNVDNRESNHGASRSGSGSPTSANASSNSRRPSNKSRPSVTGPTSAEGRETVEGTSS
ncbi:hypothetical protein BGZ97_011565 [Linnemannia gamsii]|uniref:Uncharacterized protein n=1 Tax=Linnemannia gamsii TaxID=64522 RepID=A0A9P6UMP3_9FUNG|nr:hypothetical protein BGZ97_011565 [Linnemannia gamsii]